MYLTMSFVLRYRTMIVLEPFATNHEGGEKSGVGFFNEVRLRWVVGQKTRLLPKPRLECLFWRARGALWTVAPESLMLRFEGMLTRDSGPPKASGSRP